MTKSLTKIIALIVLCQIFLGLQLDSSVSAVNYTCINEGATLSFVYPGSINREGGSLVISGESITEGGEFTVQVGASRSRTGNLSDNIIGNYGPYDHETIILFAGDLQSGVSIDDLEQFEYLLIQPYVESGDNCSRIAITITEGPTGSCSEDFVSFGEIGTVGDGFVIQAEGCAVEGNIIVSVRDSTNNTINTDTIRRPGSVGGTFSTRVGLGGDEGTVRVIAQSQNGRLLADQTFTLDEDNARDLDPSSFVGCINEPEEDKAACEACVGSVNSPTGKIWTEIGCLDPSPAGIITRMFQIAFGILGGVGILRLMQIGVLYQSQDQEKIKEARDMVFSLFAGIILMIMGIVILKFLGVNVLGLPDNFLGV